MSNLSCREMEHALGDYVANAVTPEAREAMDAHVAACAACREAATLWTGIASAAGEIAPEPLPPLVERRYAIRALGGPADAAPARPRRALWAAFAVAACAVAGLAVLLPLGPKEGAGPAVTAAPSLAAAPPESPMERAEILPDGRTLVHLDPVTDVWLDPGTDATFDRIEADDVRIALHEGRLVADIGPHAPPYRFVVVTPSGEVEAKGTIFTVEVVRRSRDAGRPSRGAVQPSLEVARVLRGVVEVRPGQSRLFDPFLVFENQQGIIGATGPSPIPRSDLQRDLALLLGQDAMEMAGWLAVIDTGCAGPDPAAHPGNRSGRGLGVANASAAGGAMPPKALGPEDLFPEPAPAPQPQPQPVSGGRHASELVERALAQRQWGDYNGAASTYRQLILEHDGTVESLTALVSLGQLELYNLGRATAASAHFESYLGRAASGTLAEEARLGLVRAYDKSNRVSDVERAATDYLAHHPKGYAAAEVCRARAEARRLTGNCEGARADYLRIQTEWPSSREAATLDSIQGACAP